MRAGEMLGRVRCEGGLDDGKRCEGGCGGGG